MCHVQYRADDEESDRVTWLVYLCVMSQLLLLLSCWLFFAVQSLICSAIEVPPANTTAVTMNSFWAEGNTASTAYPAL